MRSGIEVLRAGGIILFVYNHEETTASKLPTLEMQTHQVVESTT